MTDKLRICLSLWLQKVASAILPSRTIAVMITAAYVGDFDSATISLRGRCRLPTARVREFASEIVLADAYERIGYVSSAAEQQPDLPEVIRAGVEGSPWRVN